MRMANIKHSKNIKELRGSLILGWQKCNMTSLLCKNIWHFLIKLNMCIPYNSVITLLGTDSRENDNSSSHHQNLKAILLSFNR